MNGDVIPEGNFHNATHHLFPHHIALIPEAGGPSGSINTEETKANPYATSNYRTVLRKAYIQELEGVFGASHLMYWADSLTVRYDASNNPTTRAWFVCMAEIMNSVQVFGFPKNLLSGLVTLETGEALINAGQFAIFNKAPMFQRPIATQTGGIDGYYYGANAWLRDFATINNGATCFYRILFGGASNPVEGNVWTGLFRPWFCIKGA